MSGDDLKRKGTRQDFDSGPGRGNEPVVTMQFTGSGADKFESVTRTLAERGRSVANRLGITDKTENDVANQQFAIVLDREIKSAPTVDFDDNPSGIGGSNGAIITGVSIQEAKNLAIVLRSGTLPFKLITIEQTNISATLGKDSLQEAKLAAIAGLLVVALFLLIFYRFLGVVAVLGLGIYAALLYGVVLALNKQVTHDACPASRASSSRSESRPTRTWSSSNASKKRSVRANPYGPRSPPAIRRGSTRSSTRTS